MVYRGKPSGGCDTCRARKVKCDETRPFCSRCAKAQRTCSGYRDQLSLWFKDESDATVHKLRALHKPSSEDLTPQRAVVAVRHAVAQAYYHQHPVSSVPVLNFALDHIFQATCLFLKSYPWLNVSCLVEQAQTRTLSIGQKAMMTGIASVGLANLANLHKSQSFQLTSRREYTTALQLTNAALHDVAAVKEDTTLTAVACLSLYEIICCDKEDSLLSWYDHARGVAALLELRGEEQLHHETGQQMFQVLRNEVLIGCLQKRTRMPPALIRKPHRSDCTAQSYCADRLIEIAAGLCELQAQMSEGMVSDSAEILAVAMRLDFDLEEFTRELAAEMPYILRLRNNPQSPRETLMNAVNHYNGYYHVYQSMWMCNTWNNYRYIRILVNSLILAQLQPLAFQSEQGSNPDGIRGRCCYVRALLRQLAADICCAVPYKFGFAGEAGTQIREPLVTKAGTGFTLLLPLYLASVVDGVSGPVHAWAMKCLDIIGHEMGIQTAVSLMSVLERVQGMTWWVDLLEGEAKTDTT
ncbi:Zn(II)2Cys6 transcription factor [Aspergillus homomorphus CBS 101889]|uniref:Zn(2)-C6 fungal-type domain-containing protein n=1 Tax=Aspergillus homomorphus (strain CBS 101889) TaxID=1450537 RepID=A0A395I7X1_ASPHC|nr:hypothetical protein BO97DRAFT_468156 [Aspergillus homomorphus CBS 101889]RAL16045.1 hypothetical protein BO97DRAFT_468156 [Aspergillus homomorphus CBS 101889]